VQLVAHALHIPLVQLHQLKSCLETHTWDALRVVVATTHDARLQQHLLGELPPLHPVLRAAVEIAEVYLCPVALRVHLE
jgi:hypothetical protein